MGEVYRATDTRLDRAVALKRLPPAFASDPERLARFEREARLLASLNHPNVAQLFAFELVTLEDGSRVHLLAMELVEGDGLADRLKHGALPVDEAIAIARQIAEALEAAHEKGIVHRDLKPANVRITPDGRVKVLDFGLAKAWAGDASGVTSAPDLSQSPTLAHTGTAAGLILGTAAYMSPEQARARPVDKRADIWAFGVVVYEMLTGRRLFEGDTVSDVLAAVLKTEPDWSLLPPSVSPSLRRLLERCLERDPRLRLRDIGEARLALEDGTGWLAPSSAAPQATQPHGGGRRRALSWPAVALLAAASAFLAARWQAGRDAKALQPATRLSIPLPPGQVMSGNGGMALTRDGRTLAFAARDASGTARLYLRELDRFEVRAVPESEGAQQPFFSPDGSRVGFFARGKLMTAGVAGGAAAPIADCSAQPIGGTWGEDGTIVFTPALSMGLVRVPAAGGTPKQLTQPDDGPHGYAHGRPSFLPGGRSLVYPIWGTPAGEVRGSVLLSLEDGTSTRLTSSIWSTRYASSGHLLLSGPRGIRAAAFDPAHPGLVTPQTFVVDEVYSTAAWSDSWFAVSDTGTLAYVPGDATLGRLAWLDRDGRPSPLSDQVSLIDPSLSPDGSRIAFQDWDDNLWVLDLHRASRVRLTLDGDGSNAYAVWTRDGSRVVFASNRGGDWDIYSVAATGGQATRLLARPGNQFPTSLAPDGSIVFTERA
ncbi:MAG TPA: protein kinase, partial [Vicinamibacteria bacterium]|nr:protein kinase [Vicinamibacteria bacterium]